MSYGPGPAPQTMHLGLPDLCLMYQTLVKKEPEGRSPRLQATLQKLEDVICMQVESIQLVQNRPQGHPAYGQQFSP